MRVDGNAKYAGLLEKTQPLLLETPAALLALEGRPLVVAGSVRSGEEEPVLAAFQALRAAQPQAILAVAPRHVERAPRWLAACARQGLAARAWSSLSPASPRPAGVPVVVMDVMGQLFGLYGLARAAFLGASLVRKGGQNPMEPAAWGVPCLLGPSMEDFGDAAQALLAAGAAQTVADAAALARAWQELLAAPEQAALAGQAGRRVVAAWSGAAATAARLIVEQLQRQGALP